MKKFFWVMIFIVVSSLLWAQPEAKTPVADKVTVAQVSAPGMITFSFKDADIRNVMRLIAAKAGVNIVYGPEVTGMVNMELRDVPWEQALSLVLDLNGYAYQKEGNVIKVLRKDALAKEPLSTEVFILNYALAEDAKKAVEQMLTPERGKIEIDVRSNTLIVTDIPSAINKVEIVLARLDARTPQVLIETKVIEMKENLEKDLGIKWTSLKAYTMKFQSPSRSYRSVRRGGQGQWDSSSTSVGTEGRITSDVDTTTRDTVYTPDEGTVSDTTTGSLVNTITDTLSHSLLKSDIRSAVLSADDFELVLSALEAETDVDLISNPRIVTANNEAAEIKVVDEYPVPDYEFDTDTSQWSITGFDKEEIGVVFNVTPNISADGYVTLKILPKVSTLIGTIPFTAGGATVNIPYIAVKQASSKLVIKSGDTLAVGGLIDEDNTDVVTKIPVLGDIPVLGRLFRHREKDNTKKDIIFFITATVINEETKALIHESQSEAVVPAVFSKPVKLAEPPPSASAKTTDTGNKGYLVKSK